MTNNELKRGALRPNKQAIRAAAVILLVTAAVGCSDGFGPNPDGRLLINNNEAELNLRVHTVAGTRLALTVDRLPDFASAPQASYELILRAEVDPPVLNGVTLQATHMAFSYPKAFVAYNVQGPARMGGVDVFFVPKEDDVQLWSQGLFSDTDVSSIDYGDGDVLYLATGTSSDGFTTPAALEEIQLDDKNLTDQVRRVDLPSFAGTGVRVVNDRVYVTSGTGGNPVGGLSVFDRSSLDLVYFDEFADARSVDSWEETVVAMAGSSAKVRVYNTVPDLQAVHEVGGANIPESKSTILVVNNLVLVAAGDEGLKVVSRSDGTVLQVIPPPVVDGVAPEMSVTNGIAFHRDLVFVANGGAGLFVYQAVGELYELDAVNPQLTLMGQVQFPNGGSANFVWCFADALYVANGAGGLNIVELRHTSGAMVSP